MSGLFPSSHRVHSYAPSDLSESAHESERVVAEHALRDADRLKVSRFLAARFGEGSVEAQALGLVVRS